jgi:FMN phosphatase YigB (HAD superfamily)
MTFTPILENLQYLKTQLSEEQVLPILNQLKNGELYALNHYSTLQPIGYALFQQIVSYFVKNSQNERFIALLSNNFTDTIKAGAELYNFAQYVSFFVGRDMVKKIKPDPEGIKKIHEHFPNIQKSEIIYFGDSEKYDKMVAESYGVTFYLIRHPE